MADKKIDLSEPTTEQEDAKAEAVLGQFKRDLSHLIIHATEKDQKPKGPLIVVGPYNLQFKEKAPLSALIKLINSDNQISAMREYVELCLEGDPLPFIELLDNIDIEGLGEIVGALGEGYTSFPAKS